MVGDKLINPIVGVYIATFDHGTPSLSSFNTKGHLVTWFLRFDSLKLGINQCHYDLRSLGFHTGRCIGWLVGNEGKGRSYLVGELVLDPPLHCSFAGHLVGKI